MLFKWIQLIYCLGDKTIWVTVFISMKCSFYLVGGATPFPHVQAYILCVYFIWLQSIIMKYYIWSICSCLPFCIKKYMMCNYTNGGEKLFVIIVILIIIILKKMYDGIKSSKVNIWPKFLKATYFNPRLNQAVINANNQICNGIGLNVFCFFENGPIWCT